MIKWILAYLAAAVAFAKRDEIFQWMGTRFAGKVGGGGDWSKGCPPATENVAINTRNRNATIRFFMYGPPNPNEPSESFWNRYAKLWSKGKPVTAQTLAEVKRMRCGNCSVFDISPRMKRCLPPSPPDEYESPAQNAVFGYCWAHHFKCASTRTCTTWAAGGPIKSNEISEAFFDKYGD
jgi:hypothetical protein